MAGGGGSADAQTSLNNAAAAWNSEPKRWGRREWSLLVLAFLPIVALVVWALVAF